MSMPKQVQEAHERSNRAVEEFTKQRQQQDTPPPGDPPPQQGDTPSDPPPGDPPAPSGAQEPPKEEDWRAKYLTLQGMYRADVPRLNRELKDAQDRIAELQAEITSARAAPKNDPPPPAPAPSTKLPPAVREALGDQVSDELEAFVASRADSAAAGVRADFEPVREQASAAVKTAEDAAADRAKAARQAFMGDLARLVPDWQTIDAMERWHEYLAERDPFARRPRQDLIAEAFKDGDVEAVAAFFSDFKTKAGIKPADEPPKPNDKLARQEVPPISGGAAPNRDKPLWTQAQISEVYKRKALGKISEEDFKALEAEIVAAQKEGRVR